MAIDMIFVWTVFAWDHPSHTFRVWFNNIQHDATSQVWLTNGMVPYTATTYRTGIVFLHKETNQGFNCIFDSTVGKHPGMFFFESVHPFPNSVSITETLRINKTQCEVKWVKGCTWYSCAYDISIHIGTYLYTHYDTLCILIYILIYILIHIDTY